MSNLNGQQFSGYTPYVAKLPTDEVWEEHDYARDNYAEHEAKHNRQRVPYPPYEGPGSSYDAHVGIAARGYENQLQEAHEELTNRGEPVPPLDSVETDIAVYGLGHQHQQIRLGHEILAGGGPRLYDNRASVRERRRANVQRNMPHVEGGLVDQERRVMSRIKPRRR